MKISSYLSVPFGIRNLGFLKVAGIVILVVAAIFLGLFIAKVDTSFSVMLFDVKVEIQGAAILLLLIFWVDGIIYITKHDKTAGGIKYTFIGAVVAVSVVLSVVLHEIGHALVLQTYGSPLKGAGIGWWGAFVAPVESISSLTPWQQIAVCLAGPGVNLTLGLIATLIVAKTYESTVENTVQYFAVINLRMALYNLFPVISVLDGGRTLKALLVWTGVGDGAMKWVFPLAGCIVYLAYKMLTKNANWEEKLAKL